MLFGKRKKTPREAEDAARVGLVARIDAVLSAIADNLGGVFYVEEERPRAQAAAEKLSLARDDLAEFLYSGDGRVLGYAERIGAELRTVEARCREHGALGVISDCCDAILEHIAAWRKLI